MSNDVTASNNRAILAEIERLLVYRDELTLNHYAALMWFRKRLLRRA
jgi:hypothetical protein